MATVNLVDMLLKGDKDDSDSYKERRRRQRPGRELQLAAASQQPFTAPGVGYAKLAAALMGGLMEGYDEQLDKQANAAAMRDLFPDATGSSGSASLPTAEATVAENRSTRVETGDDAVNLSTFASVDEPVDSQSGGRLPASIRTNNPGAQYPGRSASAYGSTEFDVIGSGHKIAKFGSPEDGAAAQFDLLDRNYSGMPLNAALNKWSGGNNADQYTRFVQQRTGMAPDTMITPELLRGPQGVSLASTMAHHEAGRPYPLSPEQWQSAQSRAYQPAPGAPQPNVLTDSASGQVQPQKQASIPYARQPDDPPDLPPEITQGQSVPSAALPMQPTAAAAPGAPPAPQPVQMAQAQTTPQPNPYQVAPRPGTSLTRERAMQILADERVNPQIKQYVIQQFQPSKITWQKFGEDLVGLNDRGDVVRRIAGPSKPFEVELGDGQKITVERAPDGSLRVPKVGGMPEGGIQKPPSPKEQEAIDETDKSVASGRSAKNSIRLLKQLNETAFDGWSAEYKTWAVRNIPWMSDALKQAGNNTNLLTNIATQRALEDLKATFGGNPSDREGKLILDIQGSSKFSRAERAALYDDAERRVDDKLNIAIEKGKSLRSRDYYKKGYLPSQYDDPKPSSATSPTPGGIVARKTLNGKSYVKKTDGKWYEE